MPLTLLLMPSDAAAAPLFLSLMLIFRCFFFTRVSFFFSADERALRARVAMAYEAARDMRQRSAYSIERSEQRAAARQRVV